jgi:hypothetical protein
MWCAPWRRKDVVAANGFPGPWQGPVGLTPAHAVAWSMGPAWDPTAQSRMTPLLPVSRTRRKTKGRSRPQGKEKKSEGPSKGHLLGGMPAAPGMLLALLQHRRWGGACARRDQLGQGGSPFGVWFQGNDLLWSL